MKIEKIHIVLDITAKLMPSLIILTENEMHNVGLSKPRVLSMSTNLKNLKSFISEVFNTRPFNPFKLDFFQVCLSHLPLFPFP